MMGRVPAVIARRVWWLVPLILWASIVGLSLRSHLQQVGQHSIDVAVEGARDMFQMVVLMRAWNAEHGGVYVEVSPRTQPNPYLEHPRRDLKTTDGVALTMVNPAFMTRQLAEMAVGRKGALFHITSLKPIRPANAADPWEAGALKRFEQGLKEVYEVVETDGGAALRYMAPLLVEKSCLGCHAVQGYSEGQIRGGISVSLPYAPIAAAAVPAQRQGYLIHGLVFVLVAMLGGLLMELLRRRWQALADSVGALETAKIALQESNRHLSRARDAAETAHRAKSAFLANMSHELRTPMNAVLGFSYLLRRELTDPQHRDLLNSLEGSAQDLLEMIDQVLELARLEAGSLALTLGPFNVDDLLAGVMAKLAPVADEKGMACRVERDPDIPAALIGDQVRIAEILTHFGENAVKFSERGAVTLRVQQRGVGEGGIQLHFEVEDEGVGIPAETLPQLFRPFEQGDNSTTRRHGGAGLGLVICRRLAGLMGGDVGVRSEVGMGSVFRLDLTLPLVAVGSSPPSGPELAVSAPMGDEDLIAELLYLLAAADERALPLWQANAMRLHGLFGTATDNIGKAIAQGDYETAQRIFCAALERCEAQGATAPD